MWKIKLNLSDSGNCLSSLLNPAEIWVKQIFFLTMGLSVQNTYTVWAETSGLSKADAAFKPIQHW